MGVNQYMKFTAELSGSAYGESDHTHIEKNVDGVLPYVAKGSLAGPAGYLTDSWYFKEMEAVDEDDLPPEVAERFGVGPTPEEELVAEVDKALFGKRDVSVAGEYGYPVAVVESTASAYSTPISLLTPAESKSLDSSDLRIRWMDADGSFYVEREGARE